jgi:TusE/DsrC/DsvC family sulfur relay protein
MSDNLNAIVERLDTLISRVDYLTARQRQQEELLAELGPIARTALSASIEHLDEFERRGYFAFAKEVVEVGKRVVEGFTPSDVHQLGDAIVSILEAVRTMTQPDVLAVAADAASVMEEVSEVEPLGMLGMVRATRNDDVQKGMALMIEAMRRVGRGANMMSAKREKLDDKKAKLAKMLGSRSKRKVLGTERKRLPAASSATQAPPACATPARPQPTAAVIDGISYTADGHLADHSVWTRDLCETLAQVQGIELTAAHWQVIETARTDFVETSASPNIRRLTQIAGVTTKDIYTLFPKAPGRTIAKIAGLPKPAGCL